MVSEAMSRGRRIQYNYSISNSILGRIYDMITYEVDRIVPVNVPADVILDPSMKLEGAERYLLLAQRIYTM